MPKLASIKYCTGCLACVDSCKHNAIDIYYTNGLPYVRNNQNCIECKVCEKTCPIISPIATNKIENTHVYGGWAKNETLRINGASGGAFAAIASSFFKLYEKAIVIGATLNENVVKHIPIEKSSDIKLLMNSKYIQSNTKGIYHFIKQKLHNGYKILFSGTPCQIAGLYGFLGKNKYTDNLYTIEIICHGIPGHKALDLHLKYHQSKHILSFRDKKDGWGVNSQRTTIESNGISYRVSKEKDIFYHIYSGCLLDRKSCSNCVYSSINRVADITLADFWGKKFNKEDLRKGVSLILSNNSHGEQLIKSSSELYLFNSKLIEAINGQPRLYDGFKYIQYHPIVLFPHFFNRILPSKILLSILTNQMPWKLVWGCYRLLSIQHSKKIKKDILKRYCK